MHRTIRRLGPLVVCAFTMVQSAPAQSAPARSALAQPGGGYRVETFTTDEGLPSQAITAIAQASDGYVWIVAGGILVRFDGHTFRSYTPANTPALMRRVTDVHAGLGDTLWILDEGNAVLAYASGRLVTVAPPSRRTLWAVAQDRRGTLYGFGESVWNLRPHDGEPAEVVPRLSPVRGWSRHVSRDGNGRLWMVDSSLTLRQVGAPATPSAHTLAGWPLIDPRPNGGAYAMRGPAPRREIVRVNGDVVMTFTAAVNAQPFMIDTEGRLWVATRHAFDVFEQGRSDPVEQIPLGDGDATSVMAQGEAGCIWAGGLSLQKICRTPFRTLSVLNRASRYLVRGPRGTVLKVDSMGAVVEVAANGATRMLAADKAALRFSFAFVDQRGTTWWSLNSFATAATSRVNMLPHGGVERASTHRAWENAAWYTVGPNIFHVELSRSGRATVTDSVAVDSQSIDLSATKDGGVWAVVRRTDQSFELLHWSNGQVHRYGVADGLPPVTLRAIRADDDGTVWIGTYGAGLVRFRSGRFRAVTEREGLGDNIVTSLLEDEVGNFWMGGNRSVHRVARSDINALLDGHAKKVNGVSYRRSDGLRAPETVGFPGVRDDDGRLWFPTIAGTAVVNPVFAIALDSIPPHVHVLDIRTDRDSSAEPSGAVRLTQGARRLAVHYTGIAQRNSDAVRYEYRIDGVDADWIDAGHAREATYNDVGPGTHTFRVRAFNAGGTPSAQDATLQFIVPPYFYETPPFFVLLLAATGAATLFIVRYRERNLRHNAEQLTRVVEERTATLEATLRTVAAQSDQLRTLDETKSRFFANVSHEFRTPLSLIIGPVDDLRGGRDGELAPLVRRRLDGVQNNARRLLQLVEQLLDVARLESGTLHLSADVRDLVPLLRRLADSYASLAERRGIDFRLSCPVGGLRVRYDPDQMEKVIGNLVGNALKFTPSGGEVELRANADTDGDGTVVLEVRDTGPGIDPAYHARIFERFFQIDDSSRRAHEGTGIGLALVRELVELHGGSATVESALGAGSTFIIRLPLASGTTRISAEHAVPAPEPRHLVSPDTHLPTALSRVQGADWTTVLVVEDNADLLEYLREHLAERFRVLVANDGVRGLEMARTHVPDLIITDVMMPNMDGQALCEAVKRDVDIDFIPVILLTAKASRDSRLAGLESGADAYLTKPVDLPELLILADNFIASRRRVRERLRAIDQPLPSIRMPVKQPPRDASTAALLASFSAVLAAHLSDENFDVESMASAMGMGRSTLYRKLEPLVGKSPMDALWEYRLAQAAQWLVETTITVSEVAYGVGFKSVPHFCGKFREQYGETPSSYRRTHSTPTP